MAGNEAHSGTRALEKVTRQTMRKIAVETERLLLEALTPEVIRKLFSSQTREHIMSYLGIDHKGWEHYQAMFTQGMEMYRISHCFFLLIRKQDMLPIGECGFHTWNRQHRRAELFYLLRKDEDKKQGFMSEALPLVIRYGFEVMKLHRMEAMINKDNVPSFKLLQRNQFSFEGTRRQDYVVNGINSDSDCYTLLRPEWEAHH
jgi:ribosomal-protein-alanine N-acetyltransferase